MIRIKLKTLIDKFKFKYSPTIPGLDFNDHKSRRDWILFMAQRTGRFPVRELYDKFLPHVSRVTTNKDVVYLEEKGLVKREKEHGQKSFIVPLFEDSGTDDGTAFEQRKEFWLNIGLPSSTVILLVFLLAVHIAGL